MAYLGGKSTVYKHITNILNDKKYDNVTYLEPFFGYGHILKRVENKTAIYAGDSNELITILFNGIKNNKEYPNITKKKYYQLKNKKNSFKKALAAFCYSYGGKEWGGYFPTNGKRNYVKERQNHYNSLKKNRAFNKAILKKASYNDWEPKNLLIYCDPPYQNTTGYKTDTFNHNEFWNKMREWSKNNIVFISEYNAPSDFKKISESPKYITISGKGSIKKNQEKLFQLKKKKNVDLNKPELSLKKRVLIL